MKAVRYHAYGDSDVLVYEEADYAELVARVDAGDLEIEVAERRPLTDLAAVHDEAAAGRLAARPS